MSKPLALPFHELSHCKMVFFVSNSSQDKLRGPCEPIFRFFYLPEYIEAKLGAGLLLQSCFFPAGLLHRSEP